MARSHSRRTISNNNNGGGSGGGEGSGSGAQAGGRKCSEGMAKKRPKAQKNNDVFKVANSRSIKAKNKTKHVTTSLKKINIRNSEKVSKINKAFTEVQKEITNLSKATTSKKPLQIPRTPPAEQLNVDATTQLFSQL
ncbi:ribosomal biogenesis factor-like [Leucoraja erinacea]|uniref:ribosomal biogenesis factor-like n=1 Tax=Leucoraja erinaceus TaxID=7782 RepID=UPI002456A855|nr:ribosomal biogenesis factor-like [Leucoraja erinacea]